MEKERIVIGITQGDFNGIGFEVILKTLSDVRVLESFVPVIYGSTKAASFYRKHLDLQSVNLNIINSIDELNPKKINIINCGDDDFKVELGRSTSEAGKAAYSALEQSVADLKKGSLDALVTAPINKKNIQSADFHFPGHTEYLEENFGTGTPALMLLINDVMRVAVVTGHIPVDEIAHKLTTELITEKLLVFNKSLKNDFTIIRPRIAVLGLYHCFIYSCADSTNTMTVSTPIPNDRIREKFTIKFIDISKEFNIMKVIKNAIGIDKVAIIL